MEWIPINRDNVPENPAVVAKIVNGEVEVIHIRMVHLYYFEHKGVVAYGQNGEIVEDITHYFNPTTLKVPDSE